MKYFPNSETTIAEYSFMESKPSPKNLALDPIKERSKFKDLKEDRLKSPPETISSQKKVFYF